MFCVSHPMVCLPKCLVHITFSQHYSFIPVDHFSSFIYKTRNTWHAWFTSCSWVKSRVRVKQNTSDVKTALGRFITLSSTSIIFVPCEKKASREKVQLLHLWGWQCVSVGGLRPQKATPAGFREATHTPGCWWTGFVHVTWQAILSKSLSYSVKPFPGLLRYIALCLYKPTEYVLPRSGVEFTGGIWNHRQKYVEEDKDRLSYRLWMG